MSFDGFLKKTISCLFLLLFFFLPLFFTSVNSELFEFNKTILVYVFTVLIAGFWLGRMVLQKKIIFQRTPFDIPLALFAFSQILSTIFSIDPHTSLFGYYSRFNGGLLSTISYLLLFWALVSNCESKNIIKFLKVSFLSAAIVSIYGILEHFGYSFSCLMFTGNFDTACWIQDVQSRVFATLGQPNWLAAYLAILIPTAAGLFLMRVTGAEGLPRRGPLVGFLGRKRLAGPAPTRATGPAKYIILSLIFFLCLLFTGSRSGFAGLFVGLIIFWLGIFWINKFQLKTLIKPFFILNSSFLILVFLFGSPFSQINKYLSLESIKSYFLAPNVVPPQRDEVGSLPISNQGPALEVGGSESGAIRKIVWKGAVDTFKHYPLFGSGVETFAYSYYNFRPMEHNLVSEWDFLYNKAHNEFLNYLATTGAVGLGTYLLFIVSFVIFTFKKLKANSEELKTKVQNVKFSKKFLVLSYDFSLYTLSFALFSGWLTILVSNFFGFSVVVVSLYTFLIPAFAFVLSQNENPNPKSPASTKSLYIAFLVLLFLILYSEFLILNLWRSDYFYAIGEKLNKQGQSLPAYQNLYRAASLSPNKEPVFFNELSSAAANLFVLASSQKNASTAGEMSRLSVGYSDRAIAISPRNLNFWKTRVKVLYTLSLVDPVYTDKTVEALSSAMKLSPTDPKLVLNMGLLYGKKGETQAALSYLQKAVEMKPNYEEARNALAMFYEELGQNQKAAEQYEYVLKFIRPDDLQLKEKIENLKR